MKQYVTSKEECQSKIDGVCPGCGGEVIPAETTDNAGSPTFWPVCERCSKFSPSVDIRYFEIARGLVEKGEMVPYTHMSRHDYEDTPEHLSYYLDTQTARLTLDIMYIHSLLKRKFPDS